MGRYKPGKAFASLRTKDIDFSNILAKVVMIITMIGKTDYSYDNNLKISMIIFLVSDLIFIYISFLF